MGGACLRGDGHHWPARGSRRALTRGWRQGQLADEPDAARAHPRPQLLRTGGDADAVHQRVVQGQPDGHAIAQAVYICIRVALGERLCDALPIADSDRDAITVAERQPEGLDLALA